MHSVQADGTLGSPHVEAHGETMRDVVVHSLFHTTTKLCNSKKGSRGAETDLLKEKYNTIICFTSSEGHDTRFFQAAWGNLSNEWIIFERRY